MNKCGSVLVVLSVVMFSFSARTYAHENPLFGYTHRLPSPYTLHAGTLVIGTSAAYGVTDFLTIGTHLLSDFYKIYNADAKVSILDFPEFAMAFTGGWQAFNLHDVDTRNPDTNISTILPGIITSYALGPQLALFVGGNLSYSSVTQNAPGTRYSGLVRGGSAGSDISYAYNPHKKGVGNVLSGGAVYDFTYSLLGYGISHHWPGFHVGFTYYPGADQYKVVPILSGGASFDL